jgi:hypothetical protein
VSTLGNQGISVDPGGLIECEFSGGKITNCDGKTEHDVRVRRGAIP